MDSSLFSTIITKPLAERVRPTDFDEFFGQEDIIGKDKILLNIINDDNISSMIFWGPPGCGKTTLAKIISKKTKSKFIEFSAVKNGINDIKDVLISIKKELSLGQKTIIFVDEIHRFNKSQQDFFLPFVEHGDIILIGATTENPSFEINNALLSRMKVFVFNKLTDDDIFKILKNALVIGFQDKIISIDDKYLDLISKNSDGDARSALLTLEMLIKNSKLVGNKYVINEEIFNQCVSKKILMYDKNGELHYDIISALHKSMRNSDVDAAIYWLSRMLESGEDPLYIARRLIRFASEDIGLANIKALHIAVDTFNACNYIGMPECNVVLAECVSYLSLCSKSNSVYKAYNMAKKDAVKDIHDSVPLHLRNAPNKFMKDLGYSKNYQYSHDYTNSMTNMQCLPDNLKNKKYYNPTDNGEEKLLKQRYINILNYKSLLEK